MSALSTALMATSGRSQKAQERGLRGRITERWETEGELSEEGRATGDGFKGVMGMKEGNEEDRCGTSLVNLAMTVKVVGKVTPAFSRILDRKSVV